MKTITINVKTITTCMVDKSFYFEKYSNLLGIYVNKKNGIHKFDIIYIFI